MNIPIYATSGTARYLEDRGYKVHCVHWASSYESPKAVDIIVDGKVDLIINIKKSLEMDEFQNNAQIRKTAVKCGCSILTNLEKAMAYLRAYDSYDELQNIKDLINI